jgi:hypothetical protein
MKAEIVADRGQRKAYLENLNRIMEYTMTATQAKTDVKTGSEEKTQSVGGIKKSLGKMP